jgi:hypothetical protein
MVESRFIGPEAWMLAVSRALHRPTSLRELEATGLEPDALLRIARVDTWRSLAKSEINTRSV